MLNIASLNAQHKDTKPHEYAYDHVAENHVHMAMLDPHHVSKLHYMPRWGAQQRICINLTYMLDPDVEQDVLLIFNCLLRRKGWIHESACWRAGCARNPIPSDAAYKYHESQ